VGAVTYLSVVTVCETLSVSDLNNNNNNNNRVNIYTAVVSS